MENYSKAVIFALAALAVIVSGCAQAQIYTVTVKDGGLIGSDYFSPDTVTIRQGDSVKWINGDNQPHTVTSDSGSELSSDSLGEGGSYSHTFLKSGTYTYHCAIHPEMKGTVIVQ